MSYYENWNKKEVANFSGGIKVWEYVSYYDDGKINEKWQYIDWKEDWYWVYYRWNGYVEKEWKYENWLEEWIWRYYRDYEKLVNKEVLYSGWKIKNIKEFYENGILKRETMYSGDSIIWDNFFYENWNILSKLKFNNGSWWNWILMSFYEDWLNMWKWNIEKGKFNWHFILYYEDWEVLATGDFQNWVPKWRFNMYNIIWELYQGGDCGLRLFRPIKQVDLKTRTVRMWGQTICEIKYDIVSILDIFSQYLDENIDWNQIFDEWGMEDE